MSSGVTVVGLVHASHVLEDISVEVPYRVAVCIPPNLALRSRDLKTALEEKKVLALNGALPPGASFRGLGPVLRAASPKARAIRTPEPPTPVTSTTVSDSTLLQEVLANQAVLQTLSHTLQGGLQALVSQLAEVQASLKRIEALRPVAGIPTTTSPEEPSEVFDGGAVPHFIPAVIKDDSAQVNIQLDEQKTPSSALGSAKTALKSLRRKDG